jgi:O-acetylserine/cysteine efflux transporter
MPANQLALGVLVTMLWGLNFSIIKVAEEVFSPFMLATLRFVLCCLPAIFFLKRPKVPARYFIGYGIIFGVFQFSLLFFGIHEGLSAGLASVVLQMQVFFTIALAILLLHERLNARHVVGTLLAFGGVAIIGFATSGSATLVGTLLVVGAAASWGLSNILVKVGKPSDMVAFMVWSSLIPPIPLFLLTLTTDGWGSIEHSFAHLTWAASGSVLYLVYVTTLFGYAVWNNLLRQYRASVVAPLTLLVPVFGMLGSMVVFGEALTTTKVIAASLMVLGLLVNHFGLPTAVFARKHRLHEPAA